jgi:hypothetical protein
MEVRIGVVILSKAKDLCTQLAARESTQILRAAQDGKGVVQH